jgi:ABC-2 type transport system permease protein
MLGAVWLEQRRDFGSGLVAQRPGQPEASPSLSTPLALAVRLQRGALLGWAVGLGLISFFYGIVADQAETILEENPEFADFFAQLGQGTITDAFLATSLLILGLLATGFTISSVLRLRSEEQAGLADKVLAGPASRRRYALSHVVVAAVGTVVLMAVVGLGVGAGYALMFGDLTPVPGVLGGALVMVPAMWVFGGVALALHGLGARWAPLIWALFAFALLAGLLAQVLDLPEWVVNVSPFEHVPALPAASMAWSPVVVLLIVAVVSVVAGLFAFDRRDLA